MIKYSLIIPCFNEAANLPNLIKKCEAFAKNNFEVIIVNNGSKDNTSEILSKLLGKSSQILKVEIINNKGYGHGILEGLKKAKGEIIGWTHGDIQTDPADFLKGIKFV
jgi:glycosyltransferase involved in cell wall biosynthesis